MIDLKCFTLQRPDLIEKLQKNKGKIRPKKWAKGKIRVDKNGHSLTSESWKSELVFEKNSYKANFSKGSLG